MPKIIQPVTHSSPISLRGDDEGDIEFNPPPIDDSPGIPSAEPKVWYARWGRAIAGFFSSIRDKFTDLWRGVINASDAVALFFSNKGGESHVDAATKHIKEPSAHLQQEFSGPTQPPPSPVIYFPVPENTKNEEIPEERKGMLGALPAKPPIAAESTGKTEVAKPALAPISPGQEKFEAYLAARSEAANVPDWAFDEDCLRHADQVFKALLTLQGKPGYQLSDQQRAIYEVAKDLKSANAEYKKRIKEEEQKKAQEVERARQAEEAAKKQPGQADFEEFVAAFERHRAENTPFMIYDGSKYLDEACIQYGQANSKNFSADQKTAFQYLTRWHQDPLGSRQRLAQATQFLSLDEVEPQSSKLTEASIEAPQVDSSSPTDLDASRPPPPRPAARWISMLATMKAWDPQQIKRIAGVLSMQEDQVRKAMDGLRTIAKMASASGAPTAGNAGGVYSVEQILNYDAEASRQADDLLQSLELASVLVKKLKDGDTLVFDQAEKEFFGSLNKVIIDVANALDKKLEEMLPARSSSAAQRKIRIPSIAELTESQVTEGEKLFETYVAGYTKRSNSTSYTLPEKSNYFKAECLTFARAFTEQVAQMPVGVAVDSDRLYASFYLLDQARKRGLIED